jgi:uncharacterized protein YraI
MVCHKANPVGRVDLLHQEIYCVTEFHAQCEVFLGSDKAPLPIDLQRPVVPPKAGTKFRQKLRVWPVVVGLFAVLIVSVIGLRLLMRSPAISAETPSPAKPSATIIVPTSTTTATLLPPTAMSTVAEMAPATMTPTQLVVVLPSPSPTTVIPTKTPEPTATPLVWIPARTNRTVNVRSGPSTFFPVWTTIESETELAVVARDAQGDWYQICCSDDIPGWVASTNLTLASEADATVPVFAGQPQVIVFAENANLREGPGLDYQIMRNLEQGNRYDVVARSPGADFQWFKVCCFAGESGWLNVGTVVFSGALTDVVVDETP